MFTTVHAQYRHNRFEFRAYFYQIPMNNGFKKQLIHICTPFRYVNQLTKLSLLKRLYRIFTWKSNIDENQEREKKANFELFRDYEIEHSRFGHFKNSPQQNIHVSLNDWFCYLNVWTHLKRRNMFIVFFLTNIIFILTI